MGRESEDRQGDSDSLSDSPTWFAVVIADVQGRQAALSSAADKVAHSWPHGGIHDSMYQVVNWMDDEWNDCKESTSLSQCDESPLMTNEADDPKNVASASARGS